MIDPGYRIISARYANAEHTALIARTVEAGAVAASMTDRPALWHRIHSLVAVEPYSEAPPQGAEGTEIAAVAITPAVPAAPIKVQVSEPPAEAPAPPVLVISEGERRRLARERVVTAVVEANRLTNEDQLLHELALMVVNENVEAMHDMKDAAAAAGLPVKEYAKRTIAIHHARRRRAGYIEAIKVQALKEIDAVTGDAIEATADKAVRDIVGEE